MIEHLFLLARPPPPPRAACRNVGVVLGHKKDVSRLSQYLTLQLLSGDQVSAGAGPFCTTGCITTHTGQHVCRYARMYVHTLHDVYLDVCVCVCVW